MTSPLDSCATHTALRVGFLGGSFNPPHLSHLFLAVTALSSGEVDLVLVVPCFQHAFTKTLAPYQHRLTMTRLAFEPLGPRIVVSDVEEQLGAPSRTYNTLTHISAMHPDWTFRLIAGTDLPAQRHEWFRIEELEAMAPWLIVSRPRSPGAQGVVLPEISSTEVRRRISCGEPLHNLVPAAVARYMEEHGLYRDTLP